MDYKSELNKAQGDLLKAEKLQELMKTTNAIIRGGKDVLQRLMNEGFTETQALEIQKPDYVGRVGFADYKLINNNALIKRLKEKVKKLEVNLKGSKSETEERYLFDGGEIFVNYEINRVQVLFPGGRTSKENFQLLRRNGFVYSPSNQAFQRQINPIAIRTAISLFDAKKIDETELEKGIEVESEHTDTIDKIASGEISPEQAPEEIAKDHLIEDTKYYDKLEQVEGKKGNEFDFKNKTLDEFSNEVYNRGYDFEMLGMDKRKIQSLVKNYHATTDAENKEIAKNWIDQAISQNYGANHFLAQREQGKSETQLNPRDSWYITTQGTPFGIDRALLSLVKNGNNEEFVKDWERVMSNPNYNTKEKFFSFKGIENEESELDEKIEKLTNDLNNWVRTGGEYIKGLPKYKENVNDIEALKILKNHIPVLSAIAEQYFKDKEIESIQDQLTEYKNILRNIEKYPKYDKARVLQVITELADKLKATLPTRMINEEVELPTDVWDLIKELDQSNFFIKNAKTWNKSRSLILPKINKTIWQIAIDSNFTPGLSSSGKEEKVYFNGNSLLKAIKESYEQNGYEVADRPAEETITKKKQVESAYSSFNSELIDQIIENIQPEIYADWVGHEPREREARNSIYREIKKMDLKNEENVKNLLEAVYQKMIENETKKVKATSETYLEPNTPDEFDEVIFEHLDEKKSAQWIGNLFKQRGILKEINSGLHGPDDEKLAEVKRLFKKFYQREVSNENYDGSKELMYDPVYTWITDNKEKEPNKTTASIKREKMSQEKVTKNENNEEYFNEVINNIKDKLPTKWLGEQTGEVAVNNIIWREIELDNDGLSHNEKIDKKDKIFNILFNAERQKQNNFDEELATKYQRILNLSPDDFKAKFGIERFGIDDKLRVGFLFKNKKEIELDLTLNLKPIELYGSSISESWDRMQDIQYWLQNAQQYIDENPDLILANLKSKNKEWTSHPKNVNKIVQEKVTKNEPETIKENKMTLADFKDSLSTLDIDWKPFTSPGGETRYFKKYMFSPEQLKSGMAREITDLANKGPWEEENKGYMSIILDVKDFDTTEKIDEVYLENFIKPNTKVFNFEKDKNEDVKKGDIVRNADGQAYLIDSIEAERINTINLSDTGTPLNKQDWNKDAFLDFSVNDWGNKNEIISESDLTDFEKEQLNKTKGLSTNKKMTEKKENLGDLFEKFYEVVTFHEDARHGWLEVPKSWLKKLGIAHEISGFSYEKDGSVYLEEDADLSIFLNAVDKYITWSPNLLKKSYQTDSRIRTYPHYETPPAPKKEVVVEAKPVKVIKEVKKVNIYENADEKVLKNFIPTSQIQMLEQMAKGEESSGAVDIVKDLYAIIEKMPKPYESEGAEPKLAHLHYFVNASDWYIIEKDMDGPQRQAYGWSILNADSQNAEYGYIDIDELIKIKGVELDFYFEPTPIKEIIASKKGSNYEDDNEDEITQDLFIDGHKLDFKTQPLGEVEKSILDALNKDKVNTFTEYSTASGTIHIQYKGRFFRVSFSKGSVDISIVPNLTEKTGVYLKDSIDFKDGISISDLVDNIIAKINLVSDEEYQRQVTWLSKKEPYEETYSNPYELNKAIEKFLDEKKQSLGKSGYLDPSNYTSKALIWIRNYSGYGGLQKYGTGGKGAFFEFYTPLPVIRKMWALAYKYGYKGGAVLEPSVATGEFLTMAPHNADNVTGYEISEYSYAICQILYPKANIILEPFEKQFIKNNFTMKNKVEPKYELAIGNPPYGKFNYVESRYLTMGELEHVQAKNYAEYFIRRGLDLLMPGGLLIYIVGASIEGGGTLFLDSEISPVKEYLAEHCDLLDAYRLPDAIFERTGVTSEIIVLQKK